MIFVECKPDELLVRLLTGLPRKEVVHELKGKSGVVTQLVKWRSSTALVDEDPASVQPRYLLSLKVVNEEPALGLRLLHDPQRDNRVVVLCPELESWLVRAARDSRIDLDDYGLRSEPVALHRMINDNLRKLEQVFIDLQGCDRFSRLRSLLRP